MHVPNSRTVLPSPYQQEILIGRLCGIVWITEGGRGATSSAFYTMHFTSCMHGCAHVVCFPGPRVAYQHSCQLVCTSVAAYCMMSSPWWLYVGSISSHLSSGSCLAWVVSMLHGKWAWMSKYWQLQCVLLVYVLAWLGVEFGDEYHEYCSGSGKLYSASPRAIFRLPLQHEWYLSQISWPTMLSQINTIQPRSSLPSGTRTCSVCC